jgi:tetratricopeptide (TPR) repeat protein
MSSDSTAALDKCLDQIQKRPYDLSLHLKHLQLAEEAKDRETLDNARELLSQFFALTPSQWLAWLTDELALPQTEDNVQSALMLFERAEREVLSIEICYRHALYAVTSFCECRGWTMPSDNPDEPDEPDEMADASKINEALQEVWNVEATRDQLQKVFLKASQHLADGQRVWKLWRDWEMLLLDKEPSCVVLRALTSH